jgi:hypothetical protein
VFSGRRKPFIADQEGDIMTKVLTILITTTCLTVLYSVSHAQQLPKSGTINFHTGWKWTGEGLTVADKHMMGHGTAIGSTFNDKGSGPLHQGPASCFGTFHFIDGHGRNSGVCAFGDPDGDRIFTEYVGTDGAQGTNNIVGGTGKFIGIQGSGPWKCQGSGGNGELQCAQRLDYRLP